MQVLILAAGMGKRLGSLTKDNTKCMVKVNGVTLIERLLAIVSRHPISRIIIVVGYKKVALKDYLGDKYKEIPIVYIENEIYYNTNNIYSLYLAKKYLLEEDTLLLESDLIFDAKIVDRIMLDPYPNIVTVAKYESWMDGTVVELDPNDKVSNFINKKSFLYQQKESYYKTVNIYKFGKEFSKGFYLPFLEAYIQSLGSNSYYEEVLRVITLIDRTGLKALVVRDEKWYEIDDVQDLDIAETLFCKGNTDKYFKRFGGYWRFPKLLDFCYLVNPYFPSLALKEELCNSFDALLTQYPSGLNVNILLMSKILHVKKDYICVGNGAAELINCLMNNLDGLLGVIYPSFEEYTNRYNQALIKAYIPDNENYSYGVEDIISYYSRNENRIDNLLLINPDNPSGNFIPVPDLKILLQWTKQHNIRLIIDESFVDFTDEGLENTILRDDLLDQKGLVVIKSLSKSHGIPGLRLGVLATSDFSLLDKIKKDISIWNINSFAEYYLQIFGKYEDAYQIACLDFCKERTYFYDSLLKISFLRVVKSQANYFLCEVVDKYLSMELTNILLNNFNILIKDCSNKIGFDHRNYVRISIRSRHDNDRIINALNSIQ